MSRWGVKFPWRKVTSSEQAPGWWNYGPGERADWYVDAECGHTLVRRCVKPPQKVRCEACMPIEEDDG